MIHKVVNSKIKNGKHIYSVIYKDDPTKEIHYLTKEEITSQPDGKELISNFLKARNEKKKIRNIEKIYGIVMPPNCERLFAVKFKESEKMDLVGRKELKKYNIDALLQFYESHIDYLKDKVEAASQKKKRQTKPKSKPEQNQNENETNPPTHHKHQHHD